MFTLLSFKVMVMGNKNAFLTKKVKKQRTKAINFWQLY